MTNLENNPFYNPSAEVNYAQLKPEDAPDGIIAILKENSEKINQLSKIQNPTWENLIHELDKLDNRLQLAFAPISHLHSVLSTEEWRQAYEKILPELSEYSTNLAQHTELYEAILRIKKSSEFKNLSKTKQKIINDTLQDFEINGVNLPKEKKEQYRKLSIKLNELTTKFANNALDAKNSWKMYLDDDDHRLQGIPDAILQILKQNAQNNNKTGYQLDLLGVSVNAVLSYAEDRNLRKTIFIANNNAASELADDGKFNNAEIIVEIRQLRHQLAQLLGFNDYAERATVQRMAKNPQIVNNFLNDIKNKCINAGKREMKELEQFAKEKLGIEKLEPWDIAFAEEKLSKEKLDFSSEDLRPYLPLSKVINGLFAITKELFSVEFVIDNNYPQENLWHEDVRVFKLIDEKQKVLAKFFLDPYAREKKRGGAWMDSAVNRFLDGENLQLPIAYLVCNFTPPVGNNDSYITFDEVTTLFHEFGHGLHHMLTEVDELQASGINGIEWDAVEQPSQFMENFCSHPQCLKMISQHKETNESIPDELIDKVNKIKYFRKANWFLRQLEFAFFDLQIHSLNYQNQPTLDILEKIKQEIIFTPHYAQDRFPMRFTHIFAGGYAAGYYSYLWAEVLSADSFSAFEEEGIFNKETGMRFKKEILTKGSSRSSLESFIAFRGREPQGDALMRHNGIK